MEARVELEERLGQFWNVSFIVPIKHQGRNVLKRVIHGKLDSVECSVCKYTSKVICVFGNDQYIQVVPQAMKLSDFWENFVEKKEKGLRILCNIYMILSIIWILTLYSYYHKPFLMVHMNL